MVSKHVRFSSQLSDNQAVIMQLQILNTIISIHEHSLNIEQSSGVSYDPSAELHRIENLSTCLTAIRTFISTFFFGEGFPASCYTEISLSLFTQASHCVVTLFRLSILELQSGAWDRQRVIKEVNFGEVLNVWAKNLQILPEAAGLHISPGIATEECSWHYGRRMLSLIINWWEAKIVPKLDAHANKTKPTSLDDNLIENDGAINLSNVQAGNSEEFDMDFLDEAWMRDVFPRSFEYLREPSSWLTTDIQA